MVGLMVGFAFDKLRLYNDAINDYTKALEIDNKNAFAYYNVLLSSNLARHFV
jgi:tetratricopeptide (TPR) repeat protein